MKNKIPGKKCILIQLIKLIYFNIRLFCAKALLRKIKKQQKYLENLANESKKRKNKRYR